MHAAYVVNHAPRGLNVFHLLDTAKRHPDMKRQRTARIRARAFRAGRRLKAAPTKPAPLPTPPDTLRMYTEWEMRERMSH